MIKPQKNDIWVAPGYQGGQVVYRILSVFHKEYWSRKARKKLTVEVVKYKIRNTTGEVTIREYNLNKFLHKPIGSCGGMRHLAVRPTA